MFNHFVKMFKRQSFRLSVGLSSCVAAGIGLNIFNKNVKAESESESQKNAKKTRQLVLDGYELKQVQIMVRHGARTPIHTMNNVEEVKYFVKVMMQHIM